MEFSNQFAQGACINLKILKRREKACGIQWPLNTTLIEAVRAYKICRDESEILKPDVDVYRYRFLARILKVDVVRVNIKNAKDIKSIMDREIASKTRSSIGSDLQKQREGRVGIVEIFHNGIYHIYEGK